MDSKNVSKKSLKFNTAALWLNFFLLELFNKRLIKCSISSNIRGA
jgi:hypothetical protein